MFPKNCNGTLFNATDLNYTSTAMMSSISTSAVPTTMDTPASPEDFLLELESHQFIFFFFIFSNKMTHKKTIWHLGRQGTLHIYIATYFLLKYIIKFTIYILYILIFGISISNSVAQLDWIMCECLICESWVRNPLGLLSIKV